MREGLITVKEAADKAGIPQSAIYNWLNRGYVTGRKLGGDRFVSETSLARLLEPPGLHAHIKEGWKSATSETMAELTKAVILPKVIKAHDRLWTLVPSWAVEMCSHPHCTTTMLVRARKSVVYRKEVLMEHRLRSGQARGTKLRLVSNA